MITCNQHDYIEIACIFHMQIQLALNNGSQLIGVAKNTAYNKAKEECIIISADNGDVSIVLQELKSIKATKKNPHFDIVYFDQE